MERRQSRIEEKRFREEHPDDPELTHNPAIDNLSRQIVSLSVAPTPEESASASTAASVAGSIQKSLIENGDRYAARTSAQRDLEDHDRVVNVYVKEISEYVEFLKLGHVYPETHEVWGEIYRQLRAHRGSLARERAVDEYKQQFYAERARLDRAKLQKDIREGRVVPPKLTFEKGESIIDGQAMRYSTYLRRRAKREIACGGCTDGAEDDHRSATSSPGQGDTRSEGASPSGGQGATGYRIPERLIRERELVEGGYLPQAYRGLTREELRSIPSVSRAFTPQYLGERRKVQAAREKEATERAAFVRAHGTGGGDVACLLDYDGPKRRSGSAGRSLFADIPEQEPWPAPRPAPRLGEAESDQLEKRREERREDILTCLDALADLGVPAEGRAVQSEHLERGEERGEERSE